VNYCRFLSLGGSLIVTLLLAACGGGGDSPRDINPAAPPEAVVVGPDSFLIFPNPQVQADGSLQTTAVSYADAYYRAVDPLNERTTLAAFKAKNLFDTGTGTQVQVVFGDTRDLGYGRRMTARQNPDGTLAFFVENYLVQVGPDYAYSPLNLNAAVVRDARWFIGVNAIEFSPGPGGGVSFPKFYNFNPTTGARNNLVDLDGRGSKAMPGPCITCHGGRGDPLTPPDASGNPLFNLVQNSASAVAANPPGTQNRGDVQAHLHMFSVDTFGFSATAGFTRADQEASLKTMNKWILCSYPLVGAAAGAEDACRRAATPNEWVGSAADILKQAYGGNGLPNATFSDTFVPPTYAAGGQTSLYQNVVVPACRTCHILRGTQNNNDLDFDTLAKFQSYAERIKHHVLDFGNMPLAKIIYNAFWSSGGPAQLATFLTAQGQTATSGGAVLMPGRPITSLLDRVIKQGPTTLSAPSTRFATTYAWSVVSGPAAATLTNASSATPTFSATVDGTYVIQLIVSNGATQSTPATATIQVNNALTPAPSAIRFSDIKNVLQTAGCTTCHVSTNGPLTLLTPPLFYDSYDRNKDGLTDATDDAWFYAEVRGRVNLSDPFASAILRKPSGNHHGGGALPQPNFDATLPVGNAGRANYDLFANWILNGAPQ
jgi:mono/diheme cytochrome c family protein